MPPRHCPRVAIETLLLSSLAFLAFVFPSSSSFAFSSSPLAAVVNPNPNPTFLATNRGGGGGNKSSSKLNMSSSATTTSTKKPKTAPEVKVGDKLPSVTLMEGTADYGKPVAVNLADLTSGKKVAIFAVPGAFTPGCSKSHLPSFIEAMDELKAKGIDEVICVATNDAFVMEAWGRTSGGADAGIRFLSDSNAELTRALGLAMDSDVFVRSKRYSLVADDGVVTHYFSSAKESSDTWAPNVVAAL